MNGTSLADGLRRQRERLEGMRDGISTLMTFFDGMWIASATSSANEIIGDQTALLETMDREVTRMLTETDELIYIVEGSDPARGGGEGGGES